MRETFGSFRKSRIPVTLGSCAGDVPRLASYVNEAQQRLIYAGGETGWWGGWYKTAFNVTTTNPYIICGREIARVIDLTVCNNPVPIQNEFYEFLEAGIGTVPKSSCAEPCGILQTYERGQFPTMVDVPTTGTFKLRVYPTDDRDLGKRVLFTMLDQNGRTVTNTDGTQPVVDGEYVVLTNPFEDTISGCSKILAIQKDITYRSVEIYAFNVDTGVETLLVSLAPGEERPTYRRYYINNLPSQCCGLSTIQVLGMAKLEFIPVSTDTDFLTIGNIPALKEECEAIRFGEMDNANALQMAALKHRNAIKLLNEELTHYLGRARPAIVQPLFGTAKLEVRNVGSLI